MLKNIFFFNKYIHLNYLYSKYNIFQQTFFIFKKLNQILLNFNILQINIIYITERKSNIFSLKYIYTIICVFICIFFFF